MKNLKKLTGFIFIWVFSFFISNGVKASEKKNINERVNSLRENVLDKTKKADFPKHITSFTEDVLAQWYNWGNWGNWNNWNNWGNWSNWYNWFNY